MELIFGIVCLVVGYVMGLIHKGIHIHHHSVDNSTYDQEELDKLNLEMAKMHPNDVQTYLKNQQSGGNGEWS